jgi:hypothetical protein
MQFFYYVVQGVTALILILAANTSFADFPRLASLLARDRFLPRQFASLGDRLVFSNGVILLAIFSCILVAMFGGDTSRLIPLYAVGVFLSFTLSQSGMVRHWIKERNAGASHTPPPAPTAPHPGPGGAIADLELAVEKTRGSEFVNDQVTTPVNWKRSIIINGVGAVATFIVLCVFIVTKFIHGAWIVVVIIPLLVLLFKAIHRHYTWVATQLTTERLEPLKELQHRVVIPVSGIHRGVIHALEYARSIAPNHVTAVYVELDQATTQKLRERWTEWGIDVPLQVLTSPYRSLVSPLMQFLKSLEAPEGAIVTVVIPELIPARWWHHLLHNQSSLLLKGVLLFRRGFIVTSVPYHLEDRE